MLHRVSAKAAIVNSDGKFLVLTNSYMDVNPGPAYVPDFPGGTLEKGETSEQALLREVKEEIGIDVSNAPRQKIMRYGMPHIGYTIDIYLIWANIRDVNLSEEHCMFSWLTLQQMENLPWWGDYKELLTRLESHLKDVHGDEYITYTKAISYA